MSTSIWLRLKEPADLLDVRIGERIPELAGIYDPIPFLETVLEDVFLGEPINPDVSAVDILMLEGLKREVAGAIAHEVSNTIIDIVSCQMPTLNGAHTGYHFKVHNDLDLEITIPDRSLITPDDPGRTVAMEYIEQIREDVAEGHYVSEPLRRLAGC